jgi:hypothetical protein
MVLILLNNVDIIMHMVDLKLIDNIQVMSGN